MTADTTKNVQVELLDVVAQCLWAMVHDDDELANGALNCAVLDWMSRARDAGLWDMLPPAHRTRVRRLYRKAYAIVDPGTDELEERWHSYLG